MCVLNMIFIVCRSIFVSVRLVQYLYELVINTSDSGKSRSISQVDTIRIILHGALIGKSISNVLIGVITVCRVVSFKIMVARRHGADGLTVQRPRGEACTSHGYLSQNQQLYK